jgi:hypothetical protein
MRTFITVADCGDNPLLAFERNHEDGEQRQKQQPRQRQYQDVAVNKQNAPRLMAAFEDLLRTLSPNGSAPANNFANLVKELRTTTEFPGW